MGESCARGAEPELRLDGLLSLKAARVKPEVYCVRGLWKEGSSCRDSEPYSFLIIQIAQALYYHINDMKHQHVLIKLNKRSTPGLKSSGDGVAQSWKGTGRAGAFRKRFRRCCSSQTWDRARPSGSRPPGAAVRGIRSDRGRDTPPLRLSKEPGSRSRAPLARRAAAALPASLPSVPAQPAFLPAILQSPAVPRVRVRLPSAVTPPSWQDARPLPRRVSGSG